MPTYKLIYFNVTGLAESIRYMFHYAGIKFEDFRFSTEDWPKYKPDMPLGHVPVLEINGKKYSQSKAIGRYVAKQCNLYGSDDIENLEIDAIIDSIDDLRQVLSIYHREQDPTIKEKFKAVVLEKLPFYFDKFEEQVKKNGGHFVRGKLTWADIAYTSFAGPLSNFSNVLEAKIKLNHPELKKLETKVNAIPNIKAYLDIRPKTIF
ncbi:glutathione S-transferase-like [Odontomachus brunneus]|uniref:glutathione S-transferase-like n=1 Tax=Odontomachus brunneus TaxID=486640 RepID=UPI0013F29899|nr:glutathione S-transferase-like [Odontomachus brunneus]